MFIAQYIYETAVAYDGFLLTYLNNPELLNTLIKTYEKIGDNDNLAIVKNFVKCLQTIDLKLDYNEIIDALSEEVASQLDELDEEYPVGEENYATSFDLLI